MISPVPTIAPSQRLTDTVTAASSFRPNDPVWAWSTADAQRRPGFVNAGSDTALLVTYFRPGGGTGIDCLLPRHVMPSTTSDRQIHSVLSGRGFPPCLHSGR